MHVCEDFLVAADSRRDANSAAFRKTMTNLPKKSQLTICYNETSARNHGQGNNTAGRPLLTEEVNWGSYIQIPRPDGPRRKYALTTLMTDLIIQADCYDGTDVIKKVKRDIMGVPHLRHRDRRP